MKYITFSLFFFASTALSQVNLLVHVGLDVPSVDARTPSQTTFLANYWSSGVDASIGAEYPLSSIIWIVPSFQYVHYSWDNYNYRGPMIPEVGIVSAHGQSSSIYRASLEGRFTASHKFIIFDADLYLTTGIVYAIEDIGKINVAYSDLNGPNFTGSVTYPNRSYWNHTLGIGTRAHVSGLLALDFHAKYFTDYNQSFYMSYNFGIAYSFSQ